MEANANRSDGIPAFCCCWKPRAAGAAAAAADVGDEVAEALAAGAADFIKVNIQLIKIKITKFLKNKTEIPE